MAIPAMAGGVEAAAVWRERTGQAQELSIDLRQAVYGIAPWVRFLVDYAAAELAARRMDVAADAERRQSPGTLHPG
jgi:hypothetical protein